MRDAAGRAKVSAPVATDDIARKAETDAEAKARLQAVNSLSQAIETEAHSRAEGDNAALESLASHADNKGNPHGVTAAQVGLGNVNDTPDNEKSVKYAQTAGSAKADGGNADTVGGFNAGNGVNMLVPVVAFNAGENAGYIKLGNGLIVQWGRLHSDDNSEDISGKRGYWHNSSKSIAFPISFATNNYNIQLQGEDTPLDRDNYIIEGFLAHNRSPAGFSISHFASNGPWDDAVWWCNWFAIGI